MDVAATGQDNPPRGGKTFVAGLASEAEAETRTRGPWAEKVKTLRKDEKNQNRRLLKGV